METTRRDAMTLMGGAMAAAAAPAMAAPARNLGSKSKTLFWVASVTPCDKSLKFDPGAFKDVLAWFKHNGADGVVVLGSTGAGSPDAQIPAVYNALLGTRFKVVFGYEGGGALNLAMERGEIEGRGTNTWGSYKATLPGAVAEGKLIPLIQIGLKKDRDLPETPLFLDTVKGDGEREAVARFLSLTTAVSRPLAAPPGVPEERVTLLRKAFEATVKDPDFLAEAQRLAVDIDPMTGAEVQEAVRQILATPKEVIARTQAALEGKGR